MDMTWLEQHFYENEGFPRPNWEAIYSDVEKLFSDADQQNLWCEIARNWMTTVQTELSSDYQIHESENFILLSSQPDNLTQIFLRFLEHVLKRILRALPKIASDEGYGKYVVLEFDDLDSYYSYITHFYTEAGVYGMSSGIFVDLGYGHFAFPHQELFMAESVAAHEMTHALLSHLPIPAWLNEGMAVNIEDLITGSSPIQMDNETLSRHLSFWGDTEIQEFWSGESFVRPDEGLELSYHLAQFAVSALSQDYESFIRFSNAANHADGGESSAKSEYGVSLGELIAQFFGEGNWTPKPDRWKQAQSNKSLNTEASNAGSG